MQLEIHPEAAKNFDTKANELLTKLVPDPYVKARNQQPKAPPNLDIFVHTLPEGSITDVGSPGYTDHSGKEIARIFRHDGSVLGLFNDSYKDLLRLCEQMQKAKSLRDKVSITLLVELIFHWVEQKFKQSIDLPMTQYVLPECEKRLRDAEVWIPIAMLMTRSVIQIGKITIKPITKEMIDTWHSSVIDDITSSGDTIDPKLQHYLDNQRKKLQGYAAATIRVFAEPKRASEIAMIETEKSIAMLRVYSPANLAPEIISYCAPMGKEHIEETYELIAKDGRFIGYSIGSVYRGSPYWLLDRQTIATIEEGGIGILSDLLNSTNRTEYQDALLDSLMLYSKCALAKDPADKLIATLVALEAMLLKDGNENIQQNLAERIAFLFKAPAADRKETKRKVIKAYALRSSFIHHGHTIGTDEMDALREFMMVAWTSFFALIKAAYSYKTKADMFDHLEEMKLS